MSPQDGVSSIDDGTATATAAAVQAEQIRTLYDQSVALVLVNPVNAVIVAATLWPSPGGGLLTAWVAATVAIATVRVALQRAYRAAAPPPDRAATWARRYAALATVSGLLWGLAAVLFYDAGAVAAGMLLLFVIGGMVAGASGTLALHLPAFLGFASAAVVPTAARLVAEGNRIHLAMGGLALVYGVAMSLLAVSTNRAVAEAFRLRFENHDLVTRLLRAQVSLAKANQTLEARVAERGAALERQAAALRDAQRMESVGLLAGGIAHDFNNLLTVVLGNVDLLLADLEHEVGASTRLDEVRGAAERGAVLVSQLLAFSRRQVMVRRVLDLNEVVADVQTLLERLIGEHVALAIALHAGAVPVRADPVQLHQTIINLATNARDAMPSGGTLTIETAVVEEHAPGGTLPPGRYAVLSVRDTGVGMDEQTKRMAFDPFFTTKEMGKGTGLGLATVHGIVEQSGGHVSVESEPGRGSCFRVYLPWIAGGVPETAGARSPGTPPSPPARAATILVVEDEGPVRAVAAGTLAAAGHTVIEAGDGEQALDLLRREQVRIDLLVSDLVMARLGGLDLARRVSREWPGIPILLVSGYSRELPERHDPSLVASFLRKPFTPRELLATVTTLLEGRDLVSVSRDVAAREPPDRTAG